MNPFEVLADRQIAAPVRRADEAKERRAAARERARDIRAASRKRQDEENSRLRAYRAARRAQRDDLLEQMPALVSFFNLLRRLTIDDADELMRAIDMIDLTALSVDDRFVVLQAVASAITRVRVNAGMPEFDDQIDDGWPLIGNPLMSAFFLAKQKILGGDS